ncbi:MAG TPA: hypothetical protein VK465_06255 [Fibrobacteria bacterium]|nr:hypothetical protein [Fibrobacteria bacterium]
MRLVIERNDIIPKLVKKIENSSYYMDLIKIKHPDIGTYGTKEKYDAYCDLADRHPKLLALHAMERNRLYTIPNGATSSRTMEPDEQRFLTQACNAIRRHLKEKPFHIHGDMGVKGNKEGFLTGFSPNLGKGDSRSYSSIDKYELHTRAPFMGPFTSSASETDHQHAAMLHLYNGISSYITNGKDVLHIQPDRLELVKLHPDPNVEKEMRPFPKDFGVPAPQQPPRPFSNHEAPATFGKD